MALIKCKEPNCTCEVDTSLACKEVSSLFGMKIMLDHAIETKHLDNLLPEHQLQKQLDFVNKKIETFQIENLDHHISLFKKKLKQDTTNSEPIISVLYIQCVKGHTYPYEVNCST